MVYLAAEPATKFSENRFDPKAKYVDDLKTKNAQDK